MKLARAIFVVLAISAGFACTAAAAPSDLDASFGTGGKVTTAIGSANDFAKATTIQPDGKIVVAGYGNNGSANDFALARYNANGSLDTSFDGDGKLTTVFGTSESYANALAIQPDGKIVASGFSGSGSNFDFALARYNTDGSLDTGFDGDGKVTTSFGADTDLVKAIAIQPDGKIVAAGYSFNGSNFVFALARYNADGSLDTGFDGDGTVTTAIDSFRDFASSVAIQPNGKIVVAGSSHNGTDYDIALVRYNNDGSLDTSLNGDGKLTTAIGTGDDFGNALAPQPDGKFVVAGSSFDGGSFDVALVRYNADGSLDAGFDGDGKLTTAIGASDDGASAIAVQSDGKIVVAGNSDNGSNNDFALARYNTDGSLDTSFDGDGKVTTAIGPGDDSAWAIAVQSDGKIVAAGYSSNGSNNDFALVRYMGDPPPLAAPVAPATPTATIAKPGPGKTKSKKLKAFSGTAGPAGHVAKVEIALRRVDSRQLKRGRCLWLKTAKAKFARTKAKSKKCSKQRFLPAKGAEKWSFKLRKRLPKGRYELYVRVTLTTGESHTTFTKAQGNLLKFTVT